ncbi:zinc ABC transporter substrate-binding protein [Roseicyclus sp.]
MSRKPLTLAAATAVIASPAWAEVPRVAVDIAPVHSLVARVMEGVGTPDLIVAPGASPHEYNLRPSEASALQEAEIVVWMGEDLTPWMEGAVETLAGDATVLTLLESEGTELLPFREGALFEAHVHGEGHDDHGHDDHGHDDHGHDDHGHDDHGHDDHGHGDHGHDDHGHDDHGHDDHGHDDHGHDDHGHDDHGHDDHGHDDHGHDDHAHGAHDPHAWLSPENAALWLNTIAGALSAADPDNAGAYFANAAAGRAELEALSAEVEAMLAPVRGTGFIVFHDAYQYFEASFDLPASGAISLSDATDPSPARIAEIQDRVAEQGVACVLSEPQFDPGIVAAVMEGAEARTAVLDPLGSTLEPGPALYGDVIRGLGETLAACLSEG